MKLILITLTALLMGCANAWQDLGDGRGMRGWGGVPLRDTAPLGVVAAAASGAARAYQPVPYTDPYLFQQMNQRQYPRTIQSDYNGGYILW
jgi:hypothetical protein